jgi:proteasome accessory factor B
LAGLFLARNALDAVRGTPLAEAMRGIFAKLTRAIEGNVSFQWGDLDAAFSKKPAEQKPDDVRLFGELAQALLERREISFLYRKLSESVAVPRRLQGYYLGELDGAWYLIGRDLDRAALRMFALPRISRLKILNKTFSVPSGFDGKACLMRSFGIWNAPGDGCRQVVRVELRDYAAGLAQERRWHPTQEVRAINSKGTRVEVMFEVGSRLEDVARWVLSFGSKAKVLAPPTLINLVHDEVIAMAGS